MLRQIILCADKEVGEEIKWIAPGFFYSGNIKPFDPKEYKRYLVVSNMFKKDRIRLVVLSGAKVMIHPVCWRLRRWAATGHVSFPGGCKTKRSCVEKDNQEMAQIAE